MCFSNVFECFYKCLLNVLNDLNDSNCLFILTRQRLVKQKKFQKLSLKKYVPALNTKFFSPVFQFFTIYPIYPFVSCLNFFCVCFRSYSKQFIVGRREASSFLGYEKGFECNKILVELSNYFASSYEVCSSNPRILLKII